jgi:CRP-like cAMP-binding protein
VQDILRELDFFRGLAESSLQRMAFAAEEVSLAAEEDLFRQGASADALFVIQSGSVRLTVSPPVGGVPIVVSRLAAPAVVGERSLLGGVRAAAVVTDTPSVFLKFDRAKVQELADHDPSMMRFDAE